MIFCNYSIETTQKYKVKYLQLKGGIVPSSEFTAFLKSCDIAEATRIIDGKSEIVNETDENGNTLLHLCVKVKKNEEVRLLLEKGANVWTPDPDGIYPIELANNPLDMTA